MNCGSLVLFHVARNWVTLGEGFSFRVLGYLLSDFLMLTEAINNQSYLLKEGISFGPFQNLEATRDRQVTALWVLPLCGRDQ